MPQATHNQHRSSNRKARMGAHTDINHRAHSASIRFARACNNPDRGSRYASTTNAVVERIEADLVVAVEKSNEKGLTYAVRRLALQSVRDLQAQLDAARAAHSEALQRL